MVYGKLVLGVDLHRLYRDALCSVTAGTVVIAVMVEVIVNEARMKEKETVASSARAPAGIRTERLNSVALGS